MDTVQNLRAKAEAEGTLKTTPEQRVVVDAVDDSEQARRIIEIEQVDPEVIYVPVYDPGVVYGRWCHPAFPPVCYYPRSYPLLHSGIWFGTSFRCGPPWGYAWGHCDWHGGDVDIDSMEDYLAANSPVSPPALDRINRIN